MSCTSESTFASIALASPVVMQSLGTFASAFANRLENLTSAFARHVESVASPLASPLDRHVSLAAAFFPAFFTLLPLHLLGPAARALPLVTSASIAAAAATVARFLSMFPASLLCL